MGTFVLRFFSVMVTICLGMAIGSVWVDRITHAPTSDGEAEAILGLMLATCALWGFDKLNSYEND